MRERNLMTKCCGELPAEGPAPRAEVDERYLRSARTTVARTIEVLVVFALLVSPSGAVAQPGGGGGPTPVTAPVAEPARPRQLLIANKPWLGDFDKMLERRMIRVEAPFSRSLYFSDKGRERGLAVELVRDFERYLNVKYAKQLGKRPLTIYVVPPRATSSCPTSRRVSPTSPSATHGHRGAADARGFRAGRRRTPDDQRGRRHRPDHPSAHHARRPRRQDGARAQSVELPRKPAASQRAVGARREGPGRAGARPRFARGRGHAGHAGRGVAPGPGGRRLEGADVGAGAAQAQGANRSRAAGRRQDRLGHSQEQPAARGGDRRLLPQLGDQAGCRRLPDEQLHEARQGAEGPDGERGVQAVQGHAGAVREVRHSTTASIR